MASASDWSSFWMLFVVPVLMEAKQFPEEELGRVGLMGQHVVQPLAIIVFLLARSDVAIFVEQPGCSFILLHQSMGSLPLTIL